MRALARAPSDAAPVPPPARRGFAGKLARGPLAPGLALAAGIAAALGFAPIGLFAFTLFGLAALVALCEAAPRRAAVLGWVWGIGHFGFGVRWIAEAFGYQDKMPAWTGWIAVVGLAALLATMPAAACWATWRFARRAPAAARAWAFPAAWMATEWLRGHLFTGFPWNPLAAATLDVPAVPLAAAVLGALGVSGAVALMAAAIALGRGRARRTWLLGGAFGGPLALAAIGLANGTSAPPPTRATLRIIQPDIGQQEKWRPELQGAHLARLMALSRAPAPPGQRLILWPEVALPDNELEHEPRTRAVLATLLRPGDLLLTGGLSVDRDATGEPVRARNSLFVIDARGAILGRYDKAHLVPGGEYVPLRPLADALGLSRLAPGGLDFQPGPGARTLPLPGLPAVGPLICYEMIFPAAIVDEAHRPAWLFNPSNDAWFADTGPWQHLALARLRAIEEGLPIARATPTGVSAMIDARGRLLATLAQRHQGAIEFALPGALPPTPFARAGHAIAVGLGLLALTASRRARRT